MSFFSLDGGVSEGVIVLVDNGRWRHEDDLGRNAAALLIGKRLIGLGMRTMEARG